MAYSCRSMHTFAERVVGAARLKPDIYEEVEADPRATAQAMGVVVLSSVAGGIGLAGGQGADLIVGTLVALVGWLIWAVLIYVLGTKVFAQPQTPRRCGGVAPDHRVRGGPRRAARAWHLARAARRPVSACGADLDARRDGAGGAAGA